LGAKAARQLATYASQLGWLSSTPNPKYEKSDKSTRQDIVGRVELPDVSGSEYLVQIFEELGRYAPGANGPEAIPFSEIESYDRLMGTNLSPSEVRMVRSMSTSFVSTYFAGENPNTPAPYTSGETANTLDDRILAGFSRRMKK